MSEPTVTIHLPPKAQFAQEPTWKTIVEDSVLASFSPRRAKRLARTKAPILALTLLLGLAAWIAVFTLAVAFNVYVSGDLGGVKRTLVESIGHVAGSMGRQPFALWIASIAGVGLSILGAIAAIAPCELYSPQSLLTTIRLATKLSATAIWPLVAIAATCGVAAAIVQYLYAANILRFGPPPEVVTLLPLVPLAFWGLARRLTASAKAMATTLPEVFREPVCESCGYDLAFRKDCDVCPECGLAIRESVTAGARRRPTAWELAPSLRTWFQTTIQVILHPIRTYERITVLSDGRETGRFEQWTFRLMGLGAGIWAAIVFLATGRSTTLGPSDIKLMIFLSLVSALFFPLAGWVLHRAVASLVVLCLRGMLPDHRWLSKLFVYETSRLWLFCLVDGTLVSSFILIPRWLTSLQERLLGHQAWILNMPQEQLALLLVNALLIVGWLASYRAALRAIRWSNF